MEIRLRFLALILLAGCASVPATDEAYYRQKILILQAERDTAIRIAAHEMATREARCLDYKPL